MANLIPQPWTFYGGLWHQAVEPVATDLYTINGAGFGTKGGTPHVPNWDAEPLGVRGGIGSTIQGLTFVNSGLGTTVVTGGHSSAQSLETVFNTGVDFPKLTRTLSEATGKVYYACWYKTTGTNSVNTQWKMVRIGANDNYTGVSHGSAIYGATSGNNTPVSFGGEIITSDGLSSWSAHNTATITPSDVFTADTWHFYEVEFYAGTIDASDAYFYERCDGIETVVWENRPWLTTAEPTLPTWIITIINGLDLGPAITMHVDEMYIDESRARVVLTDNAVYTSSTKWAIQPIASYADTVVTATRKRGAFSVGETAYLHLFDDDGALVHTSSSFIVAEDAA